MIKVIVRTVPNDFLTKGASGIVTQNFVEYELPSDSRLLRMNVAIALGREVKRSENTRLLAPEPAFRKVSDTVVLTIETDSRFFDRVKSSVLNALQFEVDSHRVTV